MRVPNSPAAVFLRYRFKMSSRSHNCNKRHWSFKAGKVLETGDKSEYLPRIRSLAFAPRIGRVRQMSETVGDSTEPRRSATPRSRTQSTVRGRKVVCRFITPIMSWPGKVVAEILFDSNTCLMEARSRAESRRIPVMGVPQIEWGGREVSPSYRKNLKPSYYL